MPPLNMRARYPEVSSAVLVILGPLLGLVYVIVVTMTGAVIIVALMLYRTGQLLERAVRGNISGHL